MTHENEQRGYEADQRIDALATRQLDDAQPTSEAEFAALSAQERARWADLVWLDILLEQMEHPARQAVDRDRRVERVLSTLAAEFDEPAEILPMAHTTAETRPAATMRAPKGSHAPRRLWWSGLAAAAAALAIAFFLRSGSPRSQAHAAVEQAVAAAERPIDRQYRVRVELAGDHTAESMLYVHGGERFCLKHPAPLGELWLGGDRQQSWIVPALHFLPVRLSHDPTLIREFLREGDVSLIPQVLQVTSILSRLADQDRYELALLPDESVAGLQGMPDLSLPRIHGRRREASAAWPATIDLWADPQTGQMIRMQLAWEPGSPIEQIEMQLVGEEPQPKDWYEHARHHLPGRQVLEVGQQPVGTRP